MREIPIVELKNLIAQDCWTRDQAIEILGGDYIPRDYDGYCGDEGEGHYGGEFYEYGASKKISRLADIEIRYVEQFDYIKGDVESFSTYVILVDQAFTFNIKVIDENGNKLEGPNLWNLLPPHFNSIDYTGLCLV